MRKYLILLIGVVCLFAACAAAEIPPEETPERPDFGDDIPICGAADLASFVSTEEVEYRIAISLPISIFGQGEEIHAAIAEAPQTFAFTIRYSNHEDNQHDELERFYYEGYDGVILLPLGGSALVPIVERIHLAGIPIVLAGYVNDGEYLPPSELAEQGAAAVQAMIDVQSGATLIRFAIYPPFLPVILTAEDLEGWTTWSRFLEN